MHRQTGSSSAILVLKLWGKVPGQGVRFLLATGSLTIAGLHMDQMRQRSACQSESFLKIGSGIARMIAITSRQRPNV